MTAPTPPQAPQASPLAPAVTPLVEPHTKASVSTAEAATMAGWIKADLAAGKMTQAQADRAFAELNTLLEQRLPDVRSDEEKMLENSSLRRSRKTTSSGTASLVKSRR